MLAVETVPVANIRYLPFIHESPTDLTTIYTALQKLVALAEKLGQSHILVTADVGIYSKAQEIQWSKPESLSRKVTMQLGGMHLLMAFIARIGKLLGDGGLMELLTVTGVYASATARQMLQGKQLARAVCGIKLVLEVMSQMYPSSAEAWAKKNQVQWMDADTERGLKDLHHSFRAKDTHSSRIIAERLDVSHVAGILHRFKAVGRSQSATFTF